MPVTAKARSAIAGALRWGLSFGIGSALLVKEKTEEFVSEAVDRGQKAQQEGKTLVRQMRPVKPERKQKQSVDPLEARINVTLDRLNIPTETEILELNHQVTELSARIDELQSPAQSE
jgi:polyhydroxyalkanoate synthesis regulator phasin